MVVDSEFVDFTDAGQFTERLELFPGENTVIVGVMDKNNNYSERRFKVNILPWRYLLRKKFRRNAKYLP